MAKAIYLPTPFDLSDRKVYDVADGITVSQFLERSGHAQTLRERPTVVVLNRVELLEEEYNTILQPGDILALQSLPEAQAIPAIVTFLKAYWVQIAIAVVVAGLTLYGMQEPSLDEGSVRDSPNHNLSVRQNRARLGQAIPVLYGTARTYPDLSSQPFTQFDADGDQVAFLLYELTQGEASVDTASARFEDTLLSEFDDASIEVINPGATSTLFPRDVTISATVENLELTDSDLGPFAANATATQITSVAFDVVAPQGLFRQRSSGKFERRAVAFHFEYREIDDAGAPVGAGTWTSFGAASLSGDGPEAIRRTFRYSLPSAARYEIRMIRDTAESSGTKISDLIHWAQMRAYFADGLPVTDTTRIAVRIRATEQIGSRALTQFNIVATRKLETWSTGSGWSGTTAVTNSPAWAFADACRSTTYGGSRADAYIDLAGLEALATSFATDGFECNGVFDTQMSLWDALTRICQTCHCMPVDRAGVYQMVQDKAVTEGVQMFNMRNIVRGSFQTDYAGVLEETADHVVIQFYDEDQDYRLTSLPCVLPGGTSAKPREVKLWGVTNAEQAWEIGMRMSASNRYRRRQVSFETGLEGRIPGYMDLVHVSHFQLGAQAFAQVSGDILTYDSVDTITVTESLTGLFTTPYIVIHDLEGEPLGPYTCTVLADKTIQITDAGFVDDAGLVFDPEYARPRFSIGEGSTFGEWVKVTKVRRTGRHQYRLEGFIDNDSVYTITNGETPPAPEELAALENRVPTVSRLVARGLGRASEPTIVLTWDAANADRYVIEFSDDAGVSWSEVGRPREREFRDEPEAQGPVKYRVAGLSVFQGPWTEIDIDTTTITIQSIDNPFFKIFYASTAPTAEQEGDYWIDSDDNQIYRWDGSSWLSVQDAEIAQALLNAADAQATADGKIVTFVQSSAPTAEGVGDIWFDSDDDFKPYRWSGAAWEELPQETADWALVFGADKPEDNASRGANNLILNPGAETESLYPHVETGTGTFAATSTISHSGARAFIWTPPGSMSGGGGTLATLRFNGSVPDGPGSITAHAVQVGQRVQAHLWVRKFTASAETANRMRIRLRWGDSTGNLVSGTNSSTITPTSIYEKLQVVGVAPSGAAYVSLELIILDDNEPATLRWDDASLHISQLRIWRQTTAPSTDDATEGDLWYDTDDDLQYVFEGGAWVLSAPEGGDTATTVTDSGSGTTTASATIVRGGGVTTIDVLGRVSGSAASGTPSPWPATITLRRGGSGGTVIRTWTGIQGHYENNGVDPANAAGAGGGSFIDTDTGTGSTEYHATLSVSDGSYTEAIEITATQTYFT